MIPASQCLLLVRSENRNFKQIKIDRQQSSAKLLSLKYNHIKHYELALNNFVVGSVAQHICYDYVASCFIL